MKIDKYKSFYFQVAELAAQQSVAIRNKVGCVVVTECGLIAPGLNGTPEGWHTNECEDLVDVDEWAGYSGELITKPEVRHAEAAALDKLQSEGVSTKNAVVFITLSPCTMCAVRLIGAKVSRVIYKDEYRCTKGLDLLKKAGILVEQYVDTHYFKEG